jgi:hypothetical protein
VRADARGSGFACVTIACKSLRVLESWRRLALHCLSSALALALLAPAAAHADALRLEVPAGCGDSTSFRARVDQLAGPRASQRAVARVSIQRLARGDYRLNVKLQDAQRRSRHADCRVLLEAAALIVAFSVDPARAQKSALAETDREPAASTASAASEAPAQQEQHASTLRVVSHLELGVWRGVLPRAGVPLGIGASVVLGRLVPGVSLRYAYPVASGGAPRVVAQAFGATLVASYALWPFLQAGLGMDFDVLAGRGRGATTSQRDVTSREAVRFEVLGRLALAGRHALCLVAALDVAVHRGAFVVEGFGPVFRSDVTALSLALRWERSNF